MDSPIVPRRGHRVSRKPIIELVQVYLTHVRRTFVLVLVGMGHGRLEVRRIPCLLLVYKKLSRMTGTFYPSQFMQPEFSSQGQPPQQAGLPSAPNQSQQPQGLGAPGTYTGAPATFPGTFPQQAGMQSASAASPLNQQQTLTTQTGTALPMAFGPSHAMYAGPQSFPGMFPQQAGIQPARATFLPNQQQTPVTETGATLSMASGPPHAMYAGLPSQPTWATSGFPPQGQQSSTSGQPQGLGQAAALPSTQPPMPGMPPWAMMPGMSPWGMGGPPPIPQLLGSSPTDLSQAQQQALMYQQYMQAVAPWQFGPGGTPGWPAMPMWPPPPWMQSMYPNPGFPTGPLLSPATAPPPTGETNKSYIDGMAREPSSSSAPPPYNQQKSGDTSQASTDKPRKSVDMSEKGNILHLQVSSLTPLLLTSQRCNVDNVNVSN